MNEETNSPPPGPQPPQPAKPADRKAVPDTALKPLLGVLTNNKQGGEAHGEMKVRPVQRHGLLDYRLNRLGGEEPALDAVMTSVAGACGETRDGNLAVASDVLTAQALSLDAIFTDMMNRSLRNLGEYPEAAERYFRMAMKAQAQSRTTIEALTKLARGGEQVVKHIHLDNRGGQAVIAETVNTGGQNAIFDGQPHDKPADAPVPALRRPDPLGNGVPLPCDAEREMSLARRPLTGGAEGE